MKRAEGCRNLHIAKLTIDASGVPTYTTPKRLMGLEKFSSTENYAEATAYSDNQIDTNKKKPAFIDLAITLAQLTPQDDALISGKKRIAGKTVTTTGDAQPAFAVMYEQTNSDETSTYFVYYNVTLAKDGRENTTVGESISFDSVSVTGKAIPLPDGTLEMSFNSDDEEIKQTDIENFFKSVQMPNEASEESLEVCEIKEKKEVKKRV